jgi:signal transduction histidine kinase
LQSTLLVHVVLYWLYCILSIAMMALVWILLCKQPVNCMDLLQQLWNSCAPALIGSALLLPLILLDCLRLSNRFAGPMIRLRREMKALAEGKVSRTVQLRDGDFWHDFAEDWNRVLTRCKDGQSTALLRSPHTEGRFSRQA